MTLLPKFVSVIPIPKLKSRYLYSKGVTNTCMIDLETDGTTVIFVGNAFNCLFYEDDNNASSISHGNKSYGQTRNPAN